VISGLIAEQVWRHRGGTGYPPPVASKRKRAGHWQVYWRLNRPGETDHRAFQSTTWEDENDALEALRIADSHYNQWTAHQVEVEIFDEDPDNGNNEDGANPQPKPPTLTEWLEIWLEAKTRITPNTRVGYRRQFDLEILPALGHKHLDEIEGIDISRLINALRSCDCQDGQRGTRCQRNKSGGHGLTDVTITRYYAALHACLEYAVTEKKITDNPARRTDFIRDVISYDDAGDDGDNHVYLTGAEYRILLAAAHPDARPLIEFLAGTGARFSEATAVAVASFDPLAGRPAVRIHRAWKHDGKGGWYLGATKGRNRRTVTIGWQVVDACIPLTAGRPGDALLFQSPTGGRVDYHNFRRRRWEPAVLKAMRCALHPPSGRGRQVSPGDLAGPLCGDNGGDRSRGGRCGAKVTEGWDRCRAHVGPAGDAVSTCDCPTRLHSRPTLHDLRHSHVAWLIAAGMQMAAISRRIGHKSTAITEAVYAGILPEVNEAMAEAVDAALMDPEAKRHRSADGSGLTGAGGAGVTGGGSTVPQPDLRPHGVPR
jgi:integrase